MDGPPVYAAGVREKTAIPGAAIAIQTFGDFLGYHPHLHILVSDGCFHESGMFSVSAPVDTKALEMLFRHNVLKMLLKKGKISRDLIALMEKWRHTGFNVFVGQRIFPGDETAMENLARYIIRASFSQERMTYLQQTARVEYRSKDGSKTKVFDALEWLAAMCPHIPNKGEQMVRYYGYYSNVSRGKRKKLDADDAVPCILEPELSGRRCRRTWARLIQKIYEVDPLVCPKCNGQMRVIAFIEEMDVIRKVLKHLGLWDDRPRPKANPPPAAEREYIIEDAVPSADDIAVDPIYPAETYF